MQSGPWIEADLLWGPFKVIEPILSKLRRNCKRTFKAPRAAGSVGSFELQEPEERAGGVDPEGVVLRVEDRATVGGDGVDEAALERDGDVAAQGQGDLIGVLQVEG